MRKFTEKEDSFVIDSYRSMSSAEIGRELNRDESSIRSRLKTLSNLKKVDLSKQFIWNKEEHDYIIENFYKPHNILKKYKYYTKETLGKRLDYLFKKNMQPSCRMSKSESEKLKENYMKMPTFELSKMMRRSESQIYGHSHFLRKKGKLGRKNNEKMITDEQQKYIIENYGKKTPTQIANDLGIHFMKVAVTITYLRQDGIINKRIRPKFDKIMIKKYLKENSDKTIPEMSRELNVPESTIEYYKNL